MHSTKMCEALSCIFVCCGQRVEGSTGLCLEHQDFYNLDTWTRDILLHPMRNNIVLRGHQQGSVMGNLEDHIRYVTRERLKLPKSFVESIPAQPTYTDLYLILCENDYIDPTWNSKLLNLCFVEFLKRRKMIFADFWPNIHTHFECLLTNPTMGPAVFFFKFLQIVVRLKKQSEINPYFQNIDFKAIIDEFFTPEDNDSISDVFSMSCLASKEFLAKAAKCNDEGSKQFFYTDVYPYFQAKKAEVRKEWKKEGDDLKRELAEVVFHPRNVERWLETGGWELLEMMY